MEQTRDHLKASQVLSIWKPLTDLYRYQLWFSMEHHEGVNINTPPHGKVCNDGGK